MDGTGRRPGSMDGIGRKRRVVNRGIPAQPLAPPQISKPQYDLQPQPLHARQYTTLGPAIKRKRFSFKALFTPHPVRKLSLFSLGVLLLTGSFLVGRAWWASRNIIVDDGNSAVAFADDVDPSLLKGEGDGRINILLIGVGGEGHQAGDLSDSIILVSIDPVQKSVAMVNFPRDLQLPIPGYGTDKINAAHAFGEQYEAEGQGPKLLKETISSNLGISIHYHVRLDFEGFKEAINTVGGVEVDVKEAIYDYAYPDDQLQGFDSFTLEAGHYTMDGDMALKYARSRHSSSDFDRSRRQQEVLTAFKDKALTIDTLLNPAKVSGLIGNAGDHVQTDVQLSEITKFVELAKKIDSAKTRRINLNNEADNYLASGTGGGIVPRDGDFTELKRYLRSVMQDGYIRRENASIKIKNASGKPGTAAAVADVLKVYGYNVVGVETAEQTSTNSTVIFDGSHGSKPYTINYLERRFGVKAQDNNTTSDGVDITIIIGQDYEPKE